MSTIPKPAERGAWLQARFPFFNASDAAALYGAHPFRSLADVAVDKLQSEPTESAESEAMERGTRLEPFLLEWFGDKHGCKVITPDVLYVEGRLMATLDGVIVGNDLEWIEAKTTSQTWTSPPEHVYWQVVAQAAASGRTSCWVVWIDADMRFKQHRIVPEPEHVADVLERTLAFMDFIDLGMTPPDVEMGASHLARLYPEPLVGSYAEVDDDGLEAVLAWEQARQARIAAEKAETEAKDIACRLVGENEGARYDGRLILTWKGSARRSLDTTALKADHPDLVEQYQRDITVRMLRATKELGR